MNPTQYLVQTRSVLTIYRDCLKLLHRMVPNPTHSTAAKHLLRKQFQKHREQFDTDKIHQLKMNAVKGISNYLIYTVQRDYKMLGKKPVNIMEEAVHEGEEEEEELGEVAEKGDLEFREIEERVRKIRDQKKKEKEVL